VPRSVRGKYIRLPRNDILQSDGSTAPLGVEVFTDEQGFERVVDVAGIREGDTVHVPYDEGRCAMLVTDACGDGFWAACEDICAFLVYCGRRGCWTCAGAFNERAIRPWIE